MVRRDVCVVMCRRRLKRMKIFYLFSQIKGWYLSEKVPHKVLSSSEPQKVLFKETPSLRNQDSSFVDFFCFRACTFCHPKHTHVFTFFSSHHRTDFTLYARTQNDTHATRFEIIPGLLGVDCRRAIRLRRDHVLRVEGRRENHRRRHRRGAWRRLHAEGTFLLSRGNSHSFFSRARAEEGETLPTTTARSVGRKEQRDASSRARFFRREKVLCFAMGCCSRAFLFN